MGHFLKAETQKTGEEKDKQQFMHNSHLFFFPFMNI